MRFMIIKITLMRIIVMVIVIVIVVVIVIVREILILILPDECFSSCTHGCVFLVNVLALALTPLHLRGVS